MQKLGDIDILADDMCLRNSDALSNIMMSPLTHGWKSIQACAGVSVCASPWDGRISNSNAIIWNFLNAIFAIIKEIENFKVNIRIFSIIALIFISS